MSKLHLALAAACALGAAGLASAQTSVPEPSKEQIIAVRQATLDMGAFNIATMRQDVAAGKPVKGLWYGAFGLSRWAHALPTMFPSGTGIGETSVKTQAKPEIWKDRATFEQRAADYAAAADKLADLAKANDTEGFKAQLAEVSLACDACHAEFKAGDQKAPAQSKPRS